ncbi:hypothetical protein PQR61_35315, partial [Paraburkholderia strydomiana]
MRQRQEIQAVPRQDRLMPKAGGGRGRPGGFNRGFVLVLG